MLTHKGTKELTTKRLKLRRFTVEDAQDMFNNWASDAEVTKFMRWPPHATLDVTRELLSKWVQEYEKPDYYSWAIEYNCRLIGSIGAPSIKERDECTGIGYCIARDCWNKGITTEALEAVCNYLLMRLDSTGLKSVMQSKTLLPEKWRRNAALYMKE